MFGGTFDPPHVGHLALAEWARERLALDRVVFVPAGRPPHKRGPRLSTAAHRLAMTRLAVRRNPGFEVSAVELERSGPSYTVETLERLREGERAWWFLLVGSDSLEELHTWHEPQKVLDLATLAVARRPASRADAGPARLSAGLHGRVIELGNPLFEVSSSLVRRRARAGRSIRYLVPDTVAAYIVEHRLYPPGR
jgi:nicotinate-nucleotide adenylyltransferase